MEIRIATAPCSWGVFYADGGTSGVPWPVFLQQAAQAGYTEIELGPEGYLPVDPEILRAELKKHGLTVCAGTATVPFGKLSQAECRDFVRGLAQRLARLEVRDMVVMDGTAYEPGFEDKGAWNQTLWDRVYEGILSVNDFIREEYGLRMVFHPHAGTAIEYTAEIEKLLSLRRSFSASTRDTMSTPTAGRSPGTEAPWSSCWPIGSASPTCTSRTWTAPSASRTPSWNTAGIIR